MADAKEKKFTSKLQCGHCLNTAPMEIVYELPQVIDTVEYFPKNFEDVTRIYQLLQCPACFECTLQSYIWCDLYDDSNITIKILYPNKLNTDIPSGLPDNIHKALEAAHKVEMIDANAFAVLMRRVLEMVCIDRNATGRTLADQLRDLANKGEIPNKLVTVATNIKNLGNIGAHASLGELTKDEIPILNDLSNAILEYVYTAPYLADQAEQRLKKLKSKKAP